MDDLTAPLLHALASPQTSAAYDFRESRVLIARALRQRILPVLAALPSSFRTIPVNVHQLADYWQVPLDYIRLPPSLSGFTLWTDAQHPVIAVNRQHPSVRQRFTIAHELTHIKIHGPRGVLLRQLTPHHLSPDMMLMEIEANTGAAEILLPRSQFLRQCRAWASQRPWTQTLWDDWNAQAAPLWAQQAHVSVAVIRYQLQSTPYYPHLS